MRLKSQDLDRHLGQSSAPLAPVWLVTGDETLLCDEACSAILKAAEAQGFSERQVLHAEGGFKWHDLHQEAASVSLFAEQKVIDLRVPGGKFDKAASEALREYLTDPPTENLLLIRSPRIDGRKQRDAWFRAIDEAGVIVQIWPLDARSLPAWLGDRARRLQLELTPGALGYLAERVEGNLLAAVQELEKLRLAELEQPIDEDQVLAAVEDATHFDAFELIDAVFAGDPARTHRILATLREEGVALFAIMGALTAQLRMVQSGRKLPGPRQRLVEAFRRRVRSIGVVLAQCALIDQQAKGQMHGDAWLSLENLLLRMAGAAQLPSPESQFASLRR